MSFRKVLESDQLPAGKGRCVQVDGRPIAVFRLTEGLFACDDACPHAEASLAEGLTSVGPQGPQVECLWHGATFSLADGEVLCPPAYEGVRTYPVRERDGAIEVDAGG